MNDNIVGTNVWPNKPLTDLMAWLCHIARLIGIITAAYGLYLVQQQIEKGDFNEALQVTLASFLMLIAFYFIVHSALVQLQQIVARRFYGYIGDKQQDRRFGLLTRAIIYTLVIFVVVYCLL